MKWYIGETIVNGIVVKSSKEDHQYICAFKTTVTSDMCGKNISYRIENYHDKLISLSKVYVDNCKFFSFNENVRID